MSGRPTPIVSRSGAMALHVIAKLIVQLIVIGLIVAWVVWMHPRTGMLIAGGLWVSLTIYWTVKAKDSAEAKNSESTILRRLQPWLLNGTMILLFVPVWGLAGRFLPDFSWLTPMGLCVQGSSSLLAVLARQNLGRNWSADVRILEGHKLVLSGPYRFIRHPLYAAVIGMCLGITLVSGQYHSLLAVIILVIFYWRKIPIEEMALRDAFGQAYDQYRRKTWALIPGIV